MNRRCSVLFTGWLPAVAAALLSVFGAVCGPALAKQSPEGQSATAQDTIALWYDPALGVEPASDLGELDRLLKQHGFDVVRLSTQELTDERRLADSGFGVLVLPYGDVYPARGRLALERFLSRGGAYLSLGGRALTTPLYRVGKRWVRRESTGDVVASLAPDARWNSDARGAEPALAVTTHSRVTAFHTPGLKAYQYAGCSLPSLSESTRVLEFSVRADSRTPLLCLELRERDGSRWKYVFPVSTEWTTHRVHLADFLPYATPSRSAPDDYVHPARAATLWVGFTRQMVGEGPHTVELRGVRFAESPVPFAQVFAHPWFTPNAGLAAEFFGKNLTLRAKLPRLSCFHRSRRVTGAVRAADDDRLLAVRWKVTKPATISGWTMDLSPGLNTSAAAGQSLGSEFVPLLTVGSAPIAGVVMHTGGPFAGSVWAVVGTDGVDLLGTTLPGSREALIEICRFLCTGLVYGGVRVDARTAADQSRLVIECPMFNRSRVQTEVTAETTVSSSACEMTIAARQALPPGKRSSIRLAAFPLQPSYWRKLVVATTLHTDRRPLARLHWRLDARRALRELGDWLVKLSADSGTFCGTSFVDHRAARGLLGAYEVLGSERYLQAALRWGRRMVEEQRPDGGYRMGYGITSKGEACYVADGGEVALGIARLIRYASGDEQRRLFTSLKKYMAYRDSFRAPGGGIGVGWCLHDYGQRPPVPLDKPTRILAPEKNTYTIGCTLAAAYAYARLTGDPRDEQAAARDAEWLMPRTKSLHGAFVEGFQYAHALTTDARQRRRYAEFLRAHFVEPLCSHSSAWWRGGAGRCRVDLDGLLYCYRHLGRDPRITAEIARGSFALYSPQSPDSLYRDCQRQTLSTAAGIRVCFGYVCLPDVVSPLVTMKPFAPIPSRPTGRE